MEDVSAYLNRLKKMSLKNPIIVGFGIKDRQSFQAACASAQGAIIGTAYIKVLDQEKNIDTATKKFLSEILS